MQVTKGDAATLQFQATTDGFAPLDLTGATFETKITDAAGTVSTIANGSHTIVTAASGYFSVALTTVQTAALGKGVASIATQITQSGSPTTLHGDKILLVRSYP